MCLCWQRLSFRPTASTYRLLHLKLQPRWYYWPFIYYSVCVCGGGGLFLPYHQAQHTPTCIIRRENTRQAQPGRPRTMWMGNITEWSGYGYVEATRKAQERNYWRQLIASEPAMDGTWRRRCVCARACECVCMFDLRACTYACVCGWVWREGGCVCVVHACVQIKMVECKHHKNGCSWMLSNIHI